MPEPKVKDSQGSPLNKAFCRKFLLEKAKALRPAWKPERVSAATLEMWETKLLMQMTEWVRHLPTKGKTIMP